MSPSFKSVVIPLSQVPCDEPGPVALPKREVLVVDDDHLVADTLTIIFRKAGFAARTAYDAKSALDLALELPPDILVSDVDMPGMNGVELALALMEQCPDCPVLLVSGHATWAQLGRARDAGYDFPLLSKPVHPKEMLENVLRCLEAPSARQAALAIMDRGRPAA